MPSHVVKFVGWFVGLPRILRRAVNQYVQVVVRLSDDQMLREGADGLPASVCEFLNYIFPLSAIYHLLYQRSALGNDKRK